MFKFLSRFLSRKSEPISEVKEQSQPPVEETMAAYSVVQDTKGANPYLSDGQDYNIKANFHSEYPEEETMASGEEPIKPILEVGDSPGVFPVDSQLIALVMGKLTSGKVAFNADSEDENQYEAGICWERMQECFQYLRDIEDNDYELMDMLAIYWGEYLRKKLGWQWAMWADQKGYDPILFEMCYSNVIHPVNSISELLSSEEVVDLKNVADQMVNEARSIEDSKKDIFQDIVEIEWDKDESCYFDMTEEGAANLNEDLSSGYLYLGQVCGAGSSKKVLNWVNMQRAFDEARSYYKLDHYHRFDPMLLGLLGLMLGELIREETKLEWVFQSSHNGDALVLVTRPVVLTINPFILIKKLMASDGSVNLKRTAASLKLRVSRILFSNEGEIH